MQQPTLELLQLLSASDTSACFSISREKKHQACSEKANAFSVALDLCPTSVLHYATSTASEHGLQHTDPPPTNSKDSHCIMESRNLHVLLKSQRLMNCEAASMFTFTVYVDSSLVRCHLNKQVRDVKGSTQAQKLPQNKHYLTNV